MRRLGGRDHSASRAAVGAAGGRRRAAGSGSGSDAATGRGPKVDQYRGWLSGVVEAVQEISAPDQVVTLAISLSITRPGIYPLESRVTSDSLSEVSFHGPGGVDLGSTKTGEVLILDATGVALSLATAGRRLVLRVDSLGR